MKRLDPTLLSVIVTPLLLAHAIPASAQAPRAFYAAKPATVAAATKFVVRDTLWRCTADGCASGSKASSRALFVCQALVKEVGKVDSFRAGDEVFDAAAIEKCNSRG